MATSPSRGNKKLPNVEQIGKGPSKSQLGLQAGRVKGRWSVGGGDGEAQLIPTRDPDYGARAVRVASESHGATHAGHVT